MWIHADPDPDPQPCLGVRAKFQTFDSNSEIKQSHIRKYFSKPIRGPDGKFSEKLGGKNLVTLVL